MRDKDLYATILGIQAPWSVTDVALRPAEQSAAALPGLRGVGTANCILITMPRKRLTSGTAGLRWRRRADLWPGPAAAHGTTEPPLAVTAGAESRPRDDGSSLPAYWPGCGG